MKYLLDTCVISELISKKPNKAVIEWLDSRAENSVYLSVITIGEIEKGIEKLDESRKKRSLREWLEEDLLKRFEGRIVEIDIEVMLEWGRLSGRLEKQGKKMPAVDSMIAAIAFKEKMYLVTRNEADFKESGVEIINPWNVEK
ncbi:MAG: type II toxin-antitoxin system VapC family toxin [Planctomycetota bacterium]